MTPRGGFRPGAGRKLTAEAERKIRSVRFSDQEWELLKQKSKEKGFKTASDYIRSLVL